MKNFKVDGDKVKGGGFLVLAAGLMMAGSWLFINAREGAFDPQPETHPFAAIAQEIDNGSPTSSGAGLILGADYDEGRELFTFDMRGNPEILGQLPDGMFALIAEGQLVCEQQSETLIDMNREANIRYRIFDREGGLLSVILLEKGQCSTLPTWVGRPKETGPAFMTW